MRASILSIAAAALLAGSLVPVRGLAAAAICTSTFARPVFFSPNGDGVKDVTKVYYTIAVKAHVKLTVLNSAGTTVRTLVNADRTASSNPYVVTFNGRDRSGNALPDGSYKYVLVCTNGDGSQTLSKPIVIDRVRPSLGSLAAIPRVFWPNGDGFRDKVAAVYRLSELTLVGLRVRTPAGTTVRYAGYVWQQPGSRSRVWDGRNGSGRIQPYGSYRMLVAARDRAGNAVRKTLAITISPFTDISGQSVTFRGRILAMVQHKVLAPHGTGWYTGRSNATFGPYSRLRRGDLAVGVVKALGWQNEVPSGVTFSDLPTTSPLYKYAAIAVRHHVMSYANAQTKTFAPWSYASAASSMVAIVRGMGLAQLAANIRAQDTQTPAYIGYSAIAGDMGLRWRFTPIFPRSAYNRREFTFSLSEKIHMDSYYVDKVKALFGPAAKTIVQSRRQRAVTNTARQLIGYPYVWGGESFSEGGFDCSGFIYYVYHSKLGYSIQRTAADAGADRRYPKISRANLKPGDTIYFLSASRSHINHTGLYLGNGYFIHSTRSRGGISIDRFDSRYDSYWIDQFAWGRRIIPVVRLTDVKLSTSTITPSGSGAKYTRFYYRISKRSKCTLKVYGGRTAVRTLVNSWHAAGSQSAVWDGKNSSGNVVPLGRYTLRLVVRDEEGNVKAASRVVTVAK